MKYLTYGRIYKALFYECINKDIPNIWIKKDDALIFGAAVIAALHKRNIDCYLYTDWEDFKNTYKDWYYITDDAARLKENFPFKETFIWPFYDNDFDINDILLHDENVKFTFDSIINRGELTDDNEETNFNLR